MRGTKRGFRRTIASLLVFSLCIAAVPALPARADNKINELQNQIKEEQKKQNDTKDQKKQTENNINSLKSLYRINKLTVIVLSFVRLYRIDLHLLANALTERILKSLTMSLFHKITISHIIRQSNDQLVIRPF